MSSPAIDNGKLCLISLSDHFRRGASGNFNADKLICRETRDLVGNTTSFYPEHKTMPENKEVARSLTRRLYVISGLVADAYPEVSDIIVPIYNRTNFGRMFKDLVDLANIRDGFNFHLQTRQYTKSLSKLGDIQPDLQAMTSWNGGYRGLASLSNKLVLQSSPFDRSVR